MSVGKEAIAVVSVVYARADYVKCPHCDADIDGWCADPRGKETECDECGNSFVIAADAEVKLS